MDHAIEELARISLLEEELSILRHDLRNRFNSIRNGVFYLKRKSENTPLWENDERVPMFFDLVDDEISKGEESLGQQASIDHILPRDLRRQLLEVGIRRGLSQMEVPPHVNLQTEFCQTHPTCVWDVEVALLTRCLVENALEAVKDQQSALVQIRTGTSEDGHARLRVEDDGPGLSRELISAATQSFRTEKPGHRGIGLNVAQRIARRYSGKIEFSHLETGGLAVEVSFS